MSESVFPALVQTDGSSDQYFSFDDLPSMIFGRHYKPYGDTPIHYSSEKGCYIVHLQLVEDLKSAIDPETGNKAARSKGWYEDPRVIQWIPFLQGGPCYVCIHQKRWEYQDPDTGKSHSFLQPLPGVSTRSSMADCLLIFVFSISLFCAAHAAERVCSFLNIKISDTTISRLYKKIAITDDHEITFIGVDDVSYRKGVSYKTVVYDGNTHHLLAMLDGRDGKELEKYLEEHQKIQLICRDRANAYAAAIKKILPDCAQIADPFHMFQNISNYLHDLLKSELPSKIFIKDGKEMEKVPSKVETPKIDPNSVDTSEFPYDNEVPVDEQGNNIEFDSKQRNLNGKQYRNNEKKRQEKQMKIKNARADWAKGAENGLKKKDLCEKYDVSSSTLNKWLNMTPEEVEQAAQLQERKKRANPTDPYVNIIYKMLRDNYSPAYIYSCVLALGYQGSHATLQSVICHIALNNFNIVVGWGEITKRMWPEDVTVINRFDILKYITMNDKDKMKDSQVVKYFELLKENHPVIGVVEEAWNDFHTVIMSEDSKPEDLDVFIAKYEQSAISSFVNGIKKDIASVKNAISHSENSGFVEGCNNRYKQVLRMMFGRCGHDLLFRRNYAISSIIRIGANPQDLLGLLQ